MSITLGRIVTGPAAQAPNPTPNQSTRALIQPAPRPPETLAASIRETSSSGERIRVLDLPGPDAYGRAPARPEIDPDPARAYRDRDRVIHKYSREPTSHWHYHYKPVPAEEVHPPRNRNVVLPRKGGILDATG